MKKLRLRAEFLHRVKQRYRDLNPDLSDPEDHKIKCDVMANW